MKRHGIPGCSMGMGPRLSIRAGEASALSQRALWPFLGNRKILEIPIKSVHFRSPGVWAPVHGRGDFPVRCSAQELLFLSISVRFPIWPDCGWHRKCSKPCHLRSYPAIQALRTLAAGAPNGQYRRRILPVLSHIVGLWTPPCKGLHQDAKCAKRPSGTAGTRDLPATMVRKLFRVRQGTSVIKDAWRRAVIRV